MSHYRAIVTVSTGLLLGCGAVQTEAGTAPEPTPETQVEPQPLGPAKRVEQRPTIVMNHRGVCEEYPPESPCSPGLSCNPPPPSTVPCPPHQLRAIRKDDKGQCWSTFEMSCPPDKDCGEGRVLTTCPEGLNNGDRMLANQTYGCFIAGEERWETNHLCPPEFNNKPNPTARFFKRGGTCFGEMPYSVHCPENTKCNPPPPERVPCPPKAFLKE